MVTVETFLHVREDALQLFGFADAGERSLFKMLMGVSGIGPKLALAIVSAYGPEQLQRAIAGQDVALLASVSGVGRKTAQRICVDLKDKVGPIGAAAVSSANGAAAVVGAGRAARRRPERSVLRRARGAGRARLLAGRLRGRARRRRRHRGRTRAGRARAPARRGRAVIVDERMVDPAEQGPEDDGTLRPQRLAEFLGQPRVVGQLSVYLEAARGRGEARDHVLLAGPPGLGKTSLAHIVANEMGSRIHTISGPALERKGDMAAILTALEPHDVLFIDEIHRTPRADRGAALLGHGRRRDRHRDRLRARRAHAAPRPAAVHAGRRHHARWHAHEAAARPVRHPFPARALPRRRPGPHRRALGHHPRPAGLDRGRRGDRRPRPRHAAHRQPAAAARPRRRRRCAASSASTRRWPSRRSTSCRSTPTGSTTPTARCCRRIAEKFGGGPVGLSTLAVALGEDPGTLEEVYEPYLIQQGLIQRTPRGRVLTARGRRTLGLPELPAEPQLFD